MAVAHNNGHTEEITPERVIQKLDEIEKALVVVKRWALAMVDAATSTQHRHEKPGGTAADG